MATTQEKLNYILEKFAASGSSGHYMNWLVENWDEIDFNECDSYLLECEANRKKAEITRHKEELKRLGLKGVIDLDK